MITVNLKKILNTALLLAIYSLHLLFIQVLMESDYHNISESFSSFFASATKHHTPHPPAIQFYQQHKHYNKESKTKVSSPAYFVLLAPIFNFADLLVSEQYATGSPPYCSVLNTNSRKLYRTIRVLLI